MAVSVTPYGELMGAAKLEVRLGHREALGTNLTKAGLYLAAFGTLAYLLMFGPRVAGARRWFLIGGLQIQPSELTKLVAALLLAKLFAEERRESLGLRDVLLPGAAVGALALLIAAEPDLGTAFCLVPMFLAVAFLAGLRMRAVAALFTVLLVLGGTPGAQGEGELDLALTPVLPVVAGLTVYHQLAVFGGAGNGKTVSNGLQLTYGE